MNKRIRVVEKKLKNYWGWADHKNFIVEIYYKLRGKKRCEILIHESLHLYFPNATEEEVKVAGAGIARMLWSQKLRFIDDTDNLPLQDET